MQIPDEIVHEVVLHWGWSAGTLIGLPSIVVSIFIWWTDFRHSHALLSRYHAGTRLERFWSVVATLWAVRRDSGPLNFRESIFRRVRMRVEHEIFRPRPVFIWPHETNNEDTADKPGSPPVSRCAAKDSHKNELDKWKKYICKIYDRRHQQIGVDSPANIIGEFPGIKRYFEVLKSLDIDSNDRHGDMGKFVCSLQIKDGFVAPLHLLTGLLMHSGESWKTILGTFERDADDCKELNAAGVPDAANLRQIQLFIFNCWLLWGPSIPVGACRHWNSDYVTVQYGFGDENNSIEVVGLKNSLKKKLNELRITETQISPMAIAVSAKGLLLLSDSLARDDGKAMLDKLPEVIQTSWGGRNEDRPILEVSYFHTGDVREGLPNEEEKSYGGLSTRSSGTSNTKDEKAYRSKYYSAYFWVCLVVLKNLGGKWVPLHANESEKFRWKEIVPFFEHGNLADPETCLYSKRQLAAKAVNAIAEWSQSWKKDAPPLRFAYACAIDDSGCRDDGLAFPAWGHAEKVRDIMKGIVDRPGNEYLRTLVDFDHFRNARENEYSSCRLPELVNEFYKSIPPTDS